MLINLNENYTTVFVTKFAFRRCGLQLYILLEICSMERGICPIALLALCITLYLLTGSTSLIPRYDVTSLVTWPLKLQMVLSCRWSVDAKSLSRMVAKILSLKHFGVMTLTLSGHVMWSVRWPLEPQLVISYWSYVNTMSLSRTIAKILSAIVWINTLETNFGDFGEDRGLYHFLVTYP